MIIKYDNIGGIEWAQTIGGTRNEYINSVTETSDGGYIIGGFYNTDNLDLGNGIILTNKGNQDGMIIKFNSVGEIEWAKRIGGTNNTSISSVEACDDGGYFVGGRFYSDSMDLGNGIVLTKNSSSKYYSDAMIIKYNAEGEAEWGKAIGGSDSGQNLIESISKTSDGGCIVGGYFSANSIDLGNGVSITCQGYQAGMIIKYSSTGEVDWAKAINGSYGAEINVVSESSDGGYIIGGRSKSYKLDIGNNVILTRELNFNTAILLKYNVAGEAEWGKYIGTTDSQINSIGKTSDGGFIISGEFNESTYLENEISLNEVDGSGMIVKYSIEGEAEWAKVIDATIEATAETSDGEYIIGGDFTTDKIDLGKGVGLDNKSDKSLSVSYPDGIIAKFKKDELSNPKVVQAKSIGDRGKETINSIVKTKDGGYIVGGCFASSSIDLGNGISLANKNGGLYDGMLIKYNVEGKIEWAKGVGGNDEDDVINSVMETSDGGYIIGGYFRSTSIDLGNVTSLTNQSKSTVYADGMIIKYNAKGEVDWARGIGAEEIDSINSVEETSDGGYIVGGNFRSSNINLGNGVSLTKNSQTINYSNGMIIKYNNNGEVEYAKTIGGSANDRIKAVKATSNGKYIVIGNFESDRIELENGNILTDLRRFFNWNDNNVQAKWRN